MIFLNVCNYNYGIKIVSLLAVSDVDVNIFYVLQRLQRAVEGGGGYLYTEKHHSAHHLITYQTSILFSSHQCPHAPRTRLSVNAFRGEERIQFVYQFIPGEDSQGFISKLQ